MNTWGDISEDDWQILSSGLKGNIEELPLGPASPPLGGATGGQSWIVDLLSQPRPGLVSQLDEIFLQLVSLVLVWLREEGIERKSRLARESEGLQRHGEHLLGGSLQGRHLLQPLETLDDVERHVDQHAVHVSLHVELFEQNIGLEETDGLVHNVLLAGGGSWTPGCPLAGLSQWHHGNVPDGFARGLQGGVEGRHGEGVKGVT